MGMIHKKIKPKVRQEKTSGTLKTAYQLISLEKQKQGARQRLNGNKEARNWLAA